MIPDEPLSQKPSHSSLETDGRVLGLDLGRVISVCLALLFGLLPGFVCVEPLGLLWASVIMFGPAFLVAVFQLLFLQDKPPGWLNDWLRTRLTGGHLSPLGDRKRP